MSTTTEPYVATVDLVVASTPHPTRTPHPAGASPSTMITFADRDGFVGGLLAIVGLPTSVQAGDRVTITFSMSEETP